ncbi:hypothetical protein BVY01_01905, partial [bacterium I07]
MTKQNIKIAIGLSLMLIVSLALLRCEFKDPTENFKVILDLEFSEEIYSGDMQAEPTTNVVAQNQKLTKAGAGKSIAGQRAGTWGTAGVTEEKQYDVELFFGWEGSLELTITNDSPINTAEITFQLKGMLTTDTDDSVFVTYTPALQFGVAGAADAVQTWAKVLGDAWTDANDLVKNRVDGKDNVSNYRWYLVVVVVSDFIDMTLTEVKFIFPGTKTIDVTIDADDFRDYTLNEIKSSDVQGLL